MLLDGAPKTEFGVTDTSVIVDRPTAGIVCVMGVTQRGAVGAPVFVGNSTQFRRKLGGYHAADNFALFCIRMLDAGVALWVVRAAHYTTITDKTTVVGTKASGNITATTNVQTYEALHVGAGYNGTKITVTEAASGLADLFDITVQHTDSDVVAVTVRDVNKTPTADELADLNQRLVPGEVQLKTLANNMAVGVATLAAGAQDISLIVATDYVGDRVAKTGWWAFGPVKDALRIANINFPEPAVDAALAAYVQYRQDMRFHLATPVAAVAKGMEEYRMGNAVADGAYDHAPIDTYFGSMIAGAVNITHPTDTKRRILIPGLVDYLPQRVAVDKKLGPWRSAAGGEYGKVTSPNNGVPYNLLDADNKEDFDRIYKKGINAMVDHESFKTCAWGNRSLLLNATKLLSKENVADLLVYVVKGLKPLVEIKNFAPNDPTMWSQLYLNVKPFIESLEAGRAIRPGENKNWFWIGDQDVDFAESAVFNTQEDIDSGRYKARFVFKPIAATEFIGVDLFVADNNTIDFAINTNVQL